MLCCLGYSVTLFVGVDAMCKLKKRRCPNVEGGALDTTQSSYEKMKALNELQKLELERVLLSLQLAQLEKKDIETKYEVTRKELQDTQRQKVEIASELVNVQTTTSGGDQ